MTLANKDSILNHPNSDKSVTFTGYGVYSKEDSLNNKFSKIDYHPIKLSDDDVELEMMYCGVCGSDMHTADSGWHPLDYPQIVGHELIGKVVKVGKNVTHLKVGDIGGVGAQCWSCMGKYGVSECDACNDGNENCCPRSAGTYDGKYPDGQYTQGGYQYQWRGNSNFVFKIPEKMDPAVAAPLLCAGVTVYAPLARWCKPGQQVAVIGIGGLGHLGIQFAAKLGCEVTALSGSESKKDDVMKMGAKHFINWRDEKQFQSGQRKFDRVLCTVTDFKQGDVDKWCGFLRHNGLFLVVGAPDDTKVDVDLFTLIPKNAGIVGSGIGSRKEINEMLQFAADHDVKPWIEILPVEQAGEAWQKVRANKMKYRMVLKIKQ